MVLHKKKDRTECGNYRDISLVAHADRVCSRWFTVEQGLRQGCVLAPLLFSILITAVINVASTRFKADKSIMDALEHLRKKRGRGGGRKQLPESQFLRRRFGVCFTLTMPGLSRNHPSS